MTVQLPAPATEFLDRVERGLREVASAVRNEFGHLSGEELTAPPGPGRWSVAQCLEHLRKTGALYREKLEPALTRARPVDRGSAPERFHGGWFGRRFADMVGPDASMKVTAPKAFSPEREPLGPAVVQAFLDEQAALLTLVESARGLDLDRIRVATPVSTLVRLRVSAVFALLLNHEERHLRQAREVLEARAASP